MVHSLAINIYQYRNNSDLVRFSSTRPISFAHADTRRRPGWEIALYPWHLHPEPDPTVWYVADPAIDLWQERQIETTMRVGRTSNVFLAASSWFSMTLAAMIPTTPTVSAAALVRDKCQGVIVTFLAASTMSADWAVVIFINLRGIIVISSYPWKTCKRSSLSF